MSTYHHGDLRNTLVQLGTEMLIESGEAALSLRKLAQRAGVSHNAPYQHFTDKDALIAAIAEEGFKLLGQAMHNTFTAYESAPLQDRIAALGRTYVNFALTHRGYLGVMFSAFPSNEYPTLLAQSRETLGVFIQIIAEARNTDGHPVNKPHDAALVLWMTMHGLSAILLADKFPQDMRGGRTPEDLAEQFTAMICAGLL